MMEIYIWENENWVQAKEDSNFKYLKNNDWINVSYKEIIEMNN